MWLSSQFLTHPTVYLSNPCPTKLDIVEDCIKGFTQVQINDICNLPLFHWCSYHSHRRPVVWSGRICPWCSHAGCPKSPPCSPSALGQLLGGSVPCKFITVSVVRLTREAVDAPSLKVLKGRFGGSWSSKRCHCPCQRGCNKTVFKVLSNLNHSMILWFCGLSLVQVSEPEIQEHEKAVQNKNYFMIKPAAFMKGRTKKLPR